MSDHVYKTIELTGSSSEGVEPAIRKAVSKAAETVRNIRWLEVLETRAHVDGAEIAYWQVTVKLGFTLDD